MNKITILNNLKSKTITSQMLNNLYNEKHNVVINEEDFFFSYLIQNNNIDFIVNNSTETEFFSFDVFDIINIAHVKKSNQIQICTKNRDGHLYFNTDNEYYGSLIIINLLKAISDFKSKKSTIQNI